MAVAVVASCTIDQLDSFRTGISDAKTIMHRNVYLFKAKLCWHLVHNSNFAATVAGPVCGTDM